MNGNTNQSPPPRGAPMVLLKSKEAYRLWLPIYKNFTRIERGGLGACIDESFLKLFRFIFKARFSDPKTKIPLLLNATEVNDNIKFFLQYSWELKLIHTNKYGELAIML